jgi:hypothetical protein
MVVRFRRARGVERQQLRWVALGAGLAALAVAGTIAGAETDNVPVRDWFTGVFGGAYAGVVLGLGQLLGQSRSLVVAGATLALAAVFQPARRRVQGLVDRRFNRRRYDAARTIAAFSLRLRQQVDLDALRAELLSVVETTMQPTRASLWLRRGP